MLLPPVVPGVPPGPQHHPTLPAGRGVTPRAPRHLCRHRNVVQSSNLSHHTHFGASLPLTSTPTVTCTTGTSPQNLHVFRQERSEDQSANSRAAAKSSSRRKAYEGSSVHSPLTRSDKNHSQTQVTQSHFLTLSDVWHKMAYDFLKAFVKTRNLRCWKAKSERDS